MAPSVGIYVPALRTQRSGTPCSEKMPSYAARTPSLSVTSRGGNDVPDEVVRRCLQRSELASVTGAGQYRTAVVGQPLCERPADPRARTGDPDEGKFSNLTHSEWYAHAWAIDQPPYDILSAS